MSEVSGLFKRRLYDCAGSEFWTQGGLPSGAKPKHFLSRALIKMPELQNMPKDLIND